MPVNKRDIRCVDSVIINVYASLKSLGSDDWCSRGSNTQIVFIYIPSAGFRPGCSPLPSYACVSLMLFSEFVCPLKPSIIIAVMKSFILFTLFILSITSNLSQRFTYYDQRFSETDIFKFLNKKNDVHYIFYLSFLCF